MWKYILTRNRMENGTATKYAISKLAMLFKMTQIGQNHYFLKNFIKHILLRNVVGKTIGMVHDQS